MFLVIGYHVYNFNQLKANCFLALARPMEYYSYRKKERSYIQFVRSLVHCKHLVLVKSRRQRTILLTNKAISRRASLSISGAIPNDDESLVAVLLLQPPHHQALASRPGCRLVLIEASVLT